MIMQHSGNTKDKAMGSAGEPDLATNAKRIQL